MTSLVKDLFVRPQKWRSYLDGMRVFGVFSVLFMHTAQFATWTFSPDQIVNKYIGVVEGFLPLRWFYVFSFNAVDLFFVISGYLLGESLLRGEKTFGIAYVLKLLLDRFLRLLPVHIAAQYVTSYFTGAGQCPAWGEIFLYRNWVVESPMFYCIIPVWSVLIDYQAWVVTILAVFAGYSVRQKIEPLAIVVVVAAWCATRFYLFHSTNYPEYPTGLSIQTVQTRESADALAAVLGKIGCDVESPEHKKNLSQMFKLMAVYFDFEGRFGALSIGTLGAVLLKKTDSITEIIKNNVGVLTVFVILGWVVPLQFHPFLGPNWTGGGFVGISWTIWFRLFNAVVYTLTIMMFETVTEETVASLPIIYTGFKNLFSNKIFYTLAQLSYGIFLMHTSYAVTILYFKGTKVNGDNFSVSLWLWKGLCLSVMMVLLSLAANVFVEKPLRKVRKFVIATLFPGAGAKKTI